MKKCTDITSIEYYLQDMDARKKNSRLSNKNTKTNNFKILVQDDVKNSLYLVDA